VILNRLGALTNSMNWRYALGEVVLIVVGVSIALAGNAWYENLELRDDEVAILTELLDALELDIDRV